MSNFSVKPLLKQQDVGVAGSTVIVHVSHTTVTRVPFWLHAIIWLKLPWAHVSKVLSSLTLPSTTGFLRILWFRPVVTLDLGGWPLLDL